MSEPRPFPSPPSCPTCGKSLLKTFSVSPSKGAVQTSGCDCPPAAPVERGEPDKVREALVRVLDRAIGASVVSAREVADLCEVVGVNFLDANCEEQVADAVLSLRAAPSGEAVATLMKRGKSVSVAWDDAPVSRMPDGHHPLYTHPAALSATTEGRDDA